MGEISITQLFNDNPPREDAAIRDTFWNRFSELDWAVDTLVSGDSPGLLWTVHGETRVGKSHLVLRALADPRVRALGLRVFMVNANNQGTARKVLERMFFDFHKALFAAVPKPEHGLAAEDLARYLRELDLQKRLLEDGVAEVTDEASEGVSEGMEAGLGVGQKDVFSANLRGHAQMDERRAQKITRRPVSDHQLVAHIETQIAFLVRANEGRRVVLFLDDVDILDRQGREGGEECERLVDLLRPLAEIPQLVPIVTMRHLFFSGREKDFHDFVHVPELGTEDLRKVYDVRVARFNDGREVFDPSALEFIAANVGGRVGIFLSYLHDIFRARRRKDILPFTRDVVRGHLREQLERWRDAPATRGILSEVIRAVRAQQLEIETELDPLNVGLLHRLLHYVPGREKSYAISRLYVAAIQDLGAGGG